ncbi:hypothetical protein BIW11_06704, partial [Tropilaelaps mercedesae]
MITNTLSFRSNNETAEVVYVSFAFLWFASTHVMDWTNMVPAKRLMNFCLDKRSTNEQMSDTIASIEACREYLNGYEQSGSYVGTLKINGCGNKSSGPVDSKVLQETVFIGLANEEQELILRGNFIRIRHPQRLGMSPSALSGFSHNVIFSTKGQTAQVSTIKFLKSGRGLVFGSFVGTSGFKDPLEHVLNDQGLEADVQDVLSSPVLKFRTFELAHDLLRSEDTRLQSFRSVLGWNNELQISSFDAMIDGIKAIGISIQGVITGLNNDDNIKPPLNILDFETPSVPAVYVVPLSVSQCKSCDFAGSKGSSLAVLTELSNVARARVKFVVPGGIVVTTEAFRRFLQSPKMSVIENEIHKVLSTSNAKELQEITENCRQRIQDEPMPSCISKQIIDLLYEIFPDFSSKSFAVRSSCVGEDLENKCPAEQMDTFLGVKGEKKIITAVLKCWASQFTHYAVEFKRSLGQKLVSEMAVVIMEMVRVESAGVMLTCDPLTGNPSTIYIASHFGLEGSIVSALANPNTMRVSRDINGKFTVDQVHLDRRANNNVMKIETGAIHKEKEAISGETHSAFISTLQAIQLAQIGAEVERCYGDWCNIKWAFQGDTFFLLQARPITFMDKPSDLEISLDMEQLPNDENACISKANIGEILNSAITPLGIDIISKELGVCMRKYKGRSSRERRVAVSPYFESMMRVSHFHYFCDLSQSLRLFVPDISNRCVIESMMFNLRGRVIDDPDFYQDLADTSDLKSRVPFFEHKVEIIR